MWQVAQLARAPRGYGPRLDLRWEPLLLGRAAHRLFGDAGVNALSAQVLHEPRRPAAAPGSHRGILLRKATVIDQATRFQAPERRFHGLGRVLLLDAVRAQIVPPVPAASQHAQRGPA